MLKISFVFGINNGLKFTAWWLLLYLYAELIIKNIILESKIDAEVRAERDGVALHRRVEVVDQPADGQFGVPACVQGRS